MAYVGNDLELLAITTCTEMLDQLNPEQRIRVMAMLGSRFGGQSTPYPYRPIMQNATSAADYIEKPTEVENTDISSIKITKVSPRKKAKTNSVNKRENYTLDINLDLHPKGSIDLKDYYAQFQPRSNQENNLIIVNYLTEVLKLSNIGVNHVYTCYKHLGLKIPKLKQSLFDTKRLHGWIDTADWEDIKVAISGDNYLNHDIAKKEAEQ